MKTELEQEEESHGKTAVAAFVFLVVILIFGFSWKSERAKRVELEAALADCQWFLSAQIDRAIGDDHIDSSKWLSGGDLNLIDSSEVTE